MTASFRAMLGKFEPRCDLSALLALPSLLRYPLNFMARPDPKSTAPSHRLARVSEAVRHAMSDILSRGEIIEPALAGIVISIPRVTMSPDLKMATIFVMPLGGKNGEKVTAALNLHRKEARTLIARRLNLKFASDVRFRFDAGFEVQSKIDLLLRSPEVARDLDARAEDEN